MSRGSLRQAYLKLVWTRMEISLFFNELSIAEAVRSQEVFDRTVRIFSTRRARLS